jgi:hypothetical protein
MPKFLLNLFLQIFKALINSKIQFLFGKEFFLRFRPNRPSGQPTRLASQPSQPSALPLFSRRPHALGPSRPTRQWRIGQNTSPFHVCAARRRRLLPLSPPSGPHMSVPSPTSRRPTPATLPLLSATPRHPASASRCRVKELTPRLDSPS